MPSYIYHLADIPVRLETSFPVRIAAESKPFLSESEENWDFRVSFQAAEFLPELPDQGFWHEDVFYTSLEGRGAVFFRNYPNQPPYALLIDDDQGLICHYDKAQEHFFEDSSGILNHLGVEQLLLKSGGFLLHSSFIRWQGRGILFSAPCGTGKSTQADLWEKYLGSETLNGDRAAIRCVDGCWKAFGMPFAGTSRIYRKEQAPLAAIVTLAQGPENVIRRLRPMEAVGKLLPECSCRRWDAGFMDELLDLLLQLVQQAPVYLLECRPDEGAVQLLFRTMEKDGIL